MIAITGGAGFLGFHLAGHLGEKGEPCAMLDIAPYVEADFPEGTGFLTADVRDLEQTRSALEGLEPSCVVHGAAALPLWKAEDIHETNLEGTRNVLQAALDLGIPRVVHVSSTAVYGIPDIHPLYEDHEMVGVGPYGESKVAAEYLCHEFREKGLVVPIVRPKTFIGTGRLGVFQILYDWVESGCRIPVIGDGSNLYQLLEVGDLCEAIWLCASGPDDRCNDTFNVGAEDYRTVAEDVGALCECAGNGAQVMPTLSCVVKPVLAVAEALKLSPLYKWVYQTADTDSYVSVDKIKERLGWSAQFSNTEALIRSYEWYLAHKGEIEQGTGVTHRVAWDQGILRVFKKLLSM